MKTRQSRTCKRFSSFSARWPAYQWRIFAPAMNTGHKLRQLTIAELCEALHFTGISSPFEAWYNPDILVMVTGGRKYDIC